MTNLGTQGYGRNCIRKIQAIWRGYWARKQFKWKLRRYYRQGLGNEERRKKYMEKEMSALSAKIDQTVDNRQQKMNSFIRFDINFHRKSCDSNISFITGTWRIP
jgi:hypothetical protein